MSESSDVSDADANFDVDAEGEEEDDAEGEEVDSPPVVAPGFLSKKSASGSAGGGAGAGPTRFSKKLDLPDDFDADLYGLRRSVRSALSLS